MTKRKKNIILFGPPGSGKGTQAKKLAERFSLAHISTGDIFRDEMSRETPLGLKAKKFISDGELVPDEVTIGMLKNKVLATEDAEGFIFDGFPRTIAQAEALDEFLGELNMGVSQLISLQVDDEEIIKRILSRGKDSGRADDMDEEIIQNRIEVYKEKTSKVFGYYCDKDLTHVVNGIGSIEDIHQRLAELLQSDS